MFYGPVMNGLPRRCRCCRLTHYRFKMAWIMLLVWFVFIILCIHLPNLVDHQNPSPFAMRGKNERRGASNQQHPILNVNDQRLPSWLNPFFNESNKQDGHVMIGSAGCTPPRRPLLHLGIMTMATPNKTVRRQYLRSMYDIMLEQSVPLTASQKALIRTASASMKVEPLLQQDLNSDFPAMTPRDVADKEAPISHEDQQKQKLQERVRKKPTLFIDEQQLRVKDFVRVQFVLGRPSNDEEQARIDFESKYHGDLIVLDMEENMNNGKTYAYFKHVADTMDQHAYPHKLICRHRSPFANTIDESIIIDRLKTQYDLKGYDFVAKGDDDTFIHLPNLVEHLLTLREDMDKDELSPYVYLGRKWQGFPGQVPAMAGMLYALSWDLVKWVGSSVIPRLYATGEEDQQVGIWMHLADLNISHVNNENQWVDHPDSGQPWTANYARNHIALHQCKNDALLFGAFNHYFPVI